MTDRESPILVPLNQDEILIMGGSYYQKKLCDAFVFDVNSLVLSTVIEDVVDPLTKKSPFKFVAFENQSYQVRNNEIVALVMDES